MSKARDEANAGVQSAYGMTVEEYSAAFAAAVKPGDVNQSLDMVYYVDADQIYLGADWDGTLEPGEFSVEGDILHLIDPDPDACMDMTRVTE